MPISVLPIPTSRLLTSSYLIPSFEAAVEAVLQNSLFTRPACVSVTVQPHALRFTVVDDGPAVSENDFRNALQTLPPSSAPLPPTLAVLAALAATSAVELRIRSAQFAAVKIVRATQCLEERVVNLSYASSVLQKPGMQVDVWEIFTATPVRRRIEQARPVDSVTRTVRECVAALAVANPSSAISLRASNDALLLRSPRASRLSIDHVYAAFADSRAHPWCRVRIACEGVVMDAFVSSPGLPHSRVQCVAVNGVPAPRSWLNRTVARAWRVWVARTTSLHATSKRSPAYVFNITATTTQSTWPFEVDDIRDKHLNSLVHSAVLDALTGQFRRLEHERRTALLSRRDVRPLNTILSGGKRKRFEDAEIKGRVVKLPRSVWSAGVPHLSSKLNTLRRHPASKEPGLWPPARNQFIMPARISSSRQGVNAATVESAFKRQVPGWCNPCFNAKSDALGKDQFYVDVAVCRHGDFFDKKKISISRKVLGTLRIVGIVDNKFIIVESLSEGTIFAVDQHAISERVLFERMMQKVNDNGVKSVTLTNARKVMLSALQKEVLVEKRRDVEKWGWTIGLTGCAATEVELLQVPQACGIGGQTLILDEADQLRCHMDSLLDGGVASCMPRPLVDAIASAACHSAVRFGDRLSRHQCETMMSNLTECDNPFVCAHGRPSIVPFMVFDQPG